MKGESKMGGTFLSGFSVQDINPRNSEAADTKEETAAEEIPATQETPATDEPAPPTSSETGTQPKTESATTPTRESSTYPADGPLLISFWIRIK